MAHCAGSHPSLMGVNSIPGTMMSDTRNQKRICPSSIYLAFLAAMYRTHVLLLVDDVVDVCVALDDASRGQQQRADDELLDGVGIGAGRVEDRDAQLRHLGDGNVVGSRTAAHDAAHGGRHLLGLEVVRAQHDGHGRRGQLVELAGDSVLAGREALEPDGADGVERLDGEGGAGVAAIASCGGGRGGLGRLLCLDDALLGHGECLLKQGNLIVFLS